MKKTFEYWKNYEKLDTQIKSELDKIITDDEIAVRFGNPMNFGTAGLRSVMGAGISRMNIYTVAQTTQAFAELIKMNGKADRGVAIAYDSRNNSELFARTCAEVFAANNIRVYIYPSVRPTPCLSFAILYYGCVAGVNITASHNTSEYNGYKAYWEDGAQLPPESAAEICEYIGKTDIFGGVKKTSFDEGLSSGLIEYIGEEVDEAYLSAVLGCRINPLLLADGGDINIVYTPVHGTGYIMVPEVLRRAGVRAENIHMVKSQQAPNGNFPTVKSPNPENRACFDEAIKMIGEYKIDCDLILATDPDADRVGIMAIDDSRKFINFSGNQIGALLTDYIIKCKKKSNNLPPNACIVKSVVSSELASRICEKHGVTPIDVLTGFKYIGEKIIEYSKSGEYTFLLGFEESYGYLSGGYVRDKDAVAASLLIAEMTAYYKKEGLTLFRALQNLFAEYGFYAEQSIAVPIGGIDPMSQMKAKMRELRSEYLSEIADCEVVSVRDYLTEKIIDMKSPDDIKPTGLPVSDMLYYELSDGSRFIIRPSGTEPKIRVYILATAKTQIEVDNKLSLYSSFANELLQI